MQPLTENFHYDKVWTKYGDLFYGQEKKVCVLLALIVQLTF